MNQYLRRAVKTTDFWIEWISTFILVAGVALTSWDITPWNMWLGLIANAAWSYLSVRWRQWSLLVISIVICSLYVGGLIRYY
jgi:hypothetical protein